LLLPPPWLFSGAALASADLAKKNGCAVCHDATAKKMGPTWKDIAAKNKATRTPKPPWLPPSPRAARASTARSRCRRKPRPLRRRRAGKMDHDALIEHSKIQNAGQARVFFVRKSSKPFLTANAFHAFCASQSSAVSSCLKYHPRLPSRVVFNAV
jgi:hypothetical protein